MYLSTRKYVWIIAFIVTVLLLIGFVCMRRNYYASENYPIDCLNGVSPQILLDASRRILKMRDQGTNFTVNSFNDVLEFDISGTNIHTYSWIPVEVCWLRPRYLSIRADYVMIVLNTSGRRTGFLAFKDGVRQFGTRQMINGLWFWNGKRRNETLPPPN